MIFEAVRLALASLVEHRMRAALTALSIVIATAAVITVVAIVDATFAVFAGQLDELGAGFLFAVTGNQQSAERVRTTNTLSSGEAKAVERRVESVAAVSPFWGEPIQVTQQGRSVTAFLAPVTERYQEIQQHYVGDGRFFGTRELSQRDQVVVLGPQLVADLELGRAVGQTVRLFGAPFRVLGVLEHKDGFNAMGQPFDRLAIIPHSTGTKFSGPRRGGVLLIKLMDAVDVDRSKEEIRRVLRREHRLRPGEPDDFTLITQSEIADAVGNIRALATWSVLAIVGIALLVGGIGIMNIMLVSVTERTREIGLRMALGARKNDVLLQFLVEAGVLGGVGGLIGVGLGELLAFIAGKTIPDFPAPHVPLWAALLAFGFSVAVGVFFGFYPAMRASRLDPVEALRTE